jgi:LPS sulfotransferase NodH
MSHLVAEHTGCWSAAYPETVLKTLLAELQPADLIKKFEEITFAQRQFLSYFALYGIEPAIVDYDDLVADPEQEVRRTLTELKLLPPDWGWHFDHREIKVQRQRTPAMEHTLARLKQAIRANFDRPALY